MGIKLTARQVGDITVVDAVGKITLGDGSNALRQFLLDLVAQGHKKVVLNLKEVSYMDSSGIGELVAGMTVITNQGGTLKLAALTSRIKDLLHITKLHKLFAIHDDEAQALSSFK